MKKLTYSLYVLTLVGWVIYSFTQVDLNLTISQNSFYLSLQEKLTQLGYYQRPLSALIFTSLLALSAVNYLFLLDLAKRDKVSSRELLLLVVAGAIIGVISYPAFSHDFFNYMFDARILTKYGLNPYSFKALDFPADSWTRFMHWTHRIYPYGPLWLLLTLVPSFVGLQKFLLSLFFFKSMFSLSYSACAYLIYKIQRLQKSNPQYSVLFYAANPLIIVETLISPHNEGIIIILILVSLLLFSKGKKLLSFIFLVLSSLIKYTSLTLLPLALFTLVFKKKNFNSLSNLSLGYILLYTVSFLYLLSARELLPWYFTIYVVLAVFVKGHNLLKYNIILASIILLFKYIPYLYIGSWLPENEKIYISLQLAVPVLSLCLYLLNKKKPDIWKIS